MKKLNNCINLGQYPKWLGQFLVWLLKKRLPKNMRFKLYGRGKGSARDNRNYGAVHIRYCKRVAIYVYFYDRQLEDYRDDYKKNWELAQRVKDLETEVGYLHHHSNSPVVESMLKIQAESEEAESVIS